MNSGVQQAFRLIVMLIPITDARDVQKSNSVSFDVSARNLIDRAIQDEMIASISHDICQFISQNVLCFVYDYDLRVLFRLLIASYHELWLYALIKLC